MSIFKHELGATAMDKVTGYEGIIIGRTEWLYGCHGYTLASKRLHDGVPVESQCFDEGRLSILGQDYKHDETQTPGAVLVGFAFGMTSDCHGNKHRHAQWKQCTACEDDEQTRCVVDRWSTDYILTHCAGAKTP